MGKDRKFDREEAEELIRRAVSVQVRESGDTLAFDELAAAAAEVGVDRAALERALEDLEVERELAEERLEEERRTDLATRNRRNAFRSHLRAFVTINGLLAILDLLLGPGFFVQWPLAIWGVFLLSHSISALPRRSETAKERRKREKTERKIVRDEEKRARWRARMEAQQKLGRAVDEGVTTLIGEVAKKIDEVRAPSSPDPIRVRVTVEDPRTPSTRRTEEHEATVDPRTRARR